MTTNEVTSGDRHSDGFCPIDIPPTGGSAMVAAIEHYTCVMGRLVFDVHEHVSGSRLQRATAMLGVVLMLSLRWIQGVRFLMRRGRDPVRVLARPDVYHPYP